MNKRKTKEIQKLFKNGKANPTKIETILAQSMRVEKIVVKDEKLRTFITNDNSRGNMVEHGYDVTYGIVENEKDTIKVTK